jgi:hypothetical protein
MTAGSMVSGLTWRIFEATRTLLVTNGLKCRSPHIILSSRNRVVLLLEEPSIIFDRDDGLMICMHHRHPKMLTGLVAEQIEERSLQQSGRSPHLCLPSDLCWTWLFIRGVNYFRPVQLDPPLGSPEPRK